LTGVRTNERKVEEKSEENAECGKKLKQRGEDGKSNQTQKPPNHVQTPFFWNWVREGDDRTIRGKGGGYSPRERKNS